MPAACDLGSDDHNPVAGTAFNFPDWHWAVPLDVARARIGGCDRSDAHWPMNAPTAGLA